MKSDGYQQGQETEGLVGSAIEWMVEQYQSAVLLIKEDPDRTNMLGTMMLLLLFVWGWAYTSLTQSKNPRLQKIERKVQESHKSISTIMDTLHLIKSAHENNIKCDQLVGQHLIDCLAHAQSDDANSNSSSQNVLNMIETVEQEIHEIQHSQLRLTAKPPMQLPGCYSTTAASLAEYPSVCERLIKHQLLSGTEPNLPGCQSSVSVADDSGRTEAKQSAPVISSPLKCVSSAVNEIEAKTLKKPSTCSPNGTAVRRSLLPRTIPRKSLLERK